MRTGLDLCAALFLILVAITPARGGHPVEKYGKELPIVGQLGCGPVMDVALDGDLLCVIGRGSLFLADATDPVAPKLRGKLSGLGNTRQIAVRDGIAYITSREDGLFLVDIHDPQHPVLLCHYDTIELATGIAVSGHVAFVACRQCGVELIDVTDPRKPVHLSTVRTGEAQSVTARNGILYAGVWGTREVVICDVRDPWHPQIISRAPLDGYGDGVDVRGKYCFAATGHHSRTLSHKKGGAPGPDTPGFGQGHGMEVLDIADPAEPRTVSRVKLPPLYRLGMDMWDVIVVGDYAFVADTYNGVFVVHIADPSQLRLVAHCQLPFVPAHKDPSPAAGMAIGKGVIYVAGAWTDLHVIRATGLAQPVMAEADQPPAIAPPPVVSPDPRYTVYQAGGQVYAAASAGDTTLVAAGMAGLQVVALGPEPHKLAQYPTEGFAMNVKVFGEKVYVAEGLGGLSIWKQDASGKLAPAGRYRVPGQSIKQVVVPPPGKYALVHVGPNCLQIIDVSQPTAPKCVLEDSRLGLFYSNPIAEGLLEGRYACCQWHVTGLYWYDLAGRPRYAGDNFCHRVGSEDGPAFLGGKTLMPHRGKYLLLDRQEKRPPNELPQYGAAGHSLKGKSTIDGQTLYLSDRYTGKVSAVDLTNAKEPRWLGSLELPEHPGLVVVHQGMPLVPAGYQGLLIWHLPARKP